MRPETVAFKVVSGNPEPHELAALIAVLAAGRRSRTGTEKPRIRHVEEFTPASWAARPIPGWRTAS